MGKWNSFPLGQLSKIRRGASPRPIDNPEFFSDEGRGWIRIADLAKTDKYLLYTSQYLSPQGVRCSVKVNPGDLILSICATIGKPIIVSIPACIHDGFVHFFDHPDCDRDFLYYFLQGNRNKILSSAQTGTQGNLNTDILKKFTAPFPEDIHEQAKIAEVLTAIDTAIENTKALIVKYRKIKEGMLQDLLTNGIDERGQIRSPKTHKYKPSKLGMIPVEWECVPFKKIVGRVHDYRGRTPKKLNMEWGDGDIPALSANNVCMGCVDFSKETNYGSLSLYEKWMTHGPIHKGDVLFTMEAPLGNVALVPEEKPFILSQRTIVIECNALCKNEFLYQLLMSRNFQLYLSIFASGTTAKGIQRAQLYKLFIAFPESIKEQQAIIEKICACDCIIENYVLTLTKLELQKQGLMQDLLTNKVSVEPLLRKGGIA